MALSNKLKADYIELINQQLDHIRIECIEEFDLVQEALTNIITPKENYAVPEALQERISDISDILNSPECYVQSEHNYAEYQEIIRDRIQAKALEFQSITGEQKLAYIQAHQERSTTAAQYQQQVTSRQAPQPGSDKHTISEREFLLQQQRQFAEEWRQTRAAAQLEPRAIPSQLSQNEELGRNAPIGAIQGNPNIISQILLNLLSPERLRTVLFATSTPPTDYSRPEFTVHTSGLRAINPQNLPLGADRDGIYLGPQRNLSETAQQHGFFRSRQPNTAQQARELATELAGSEAVRL